MNTLTRRNFLKQSSAAVVVGAATLGFPSLIRAQGLNEKLQVGFIACGGRARKLIPLAHTAGLQCIAFAETDRRRWDGVLEKEGWAAATGYTDWRQLFANHEKELDVIFVATPDHTHYAPTMTAISKGIHCYTEKPLSWSVREAQLLTAAYKKSTGVVTQMGNQGHAGGGWRKAYEYIKGGAIGDVLEFHTWTNRPIWPQGNGRPDYTTPVPEHLDWEAWIGAAPMRPFAGPVSGQGRGPYHSFNWRGFVDFGSGALGDMACHQTDGIYAIMEPGYAATAEPIEMNGSVGDQWPAGMVVKNTYRATADRPGFSAFWYEGKDADGNAYQPESPEEFVAAGRELPPNGNLIIGSKANMFADGAYWNSLQLLPETLRREFGRPEKLLERSPGHHEEFFMACRGEKPREFSQSNFAYAGPMTANIQLGNLCVRAGKKLELNEEGVITNDPSVNELAWREPRDGWGPMAMNI